MQELSFFRHLDRDGDGIISPDDLFCAARDLNWAWQETPLYAVLHLFSINQVLDSTTFYAITGLMQSDPQGPFGTVLNLLQYKNFYGLKLKQRINYRKKSDVCGKMSESTTDAEDSFHISGLVEYLNRDSTDHASKAYHQLLVNLDRSIHSPKISDCVFLFIDPQFSFIDGVWMKSMGLSGKKEVGPIKTAFLNIVELLKKQSNHLDCMFTRCPFPPESYNWAEPLSEILDPRQSYFLKPGNNAFYPATNGYRLWLDHNLKSGKNYVIIAGCTLNSCVRVSARETARYLKNSDLQVVVDLNLCGARRSNYLPNPDFNGLSSIEAAVQEMRHYGIIVTNGLDFES